MGPREEDDLRPLESSEEALARVRAACNIVFDNTAEMISLFSVSADGTLIVEAVNRAFMEELDRVGMRVPMRDIIGHDVRTVQRRIGQSPDLIEYSVRMYEAVASTKTRIRGESESQTPVGRVVIEEDVRPVMDRAGKVTHVLWVARDITERRRTEEALRESEERYRHVFENSADLLYLLEVREDGRFRVLEVNPAVEHSTGNPRENIVGKTTDQTVPPEAVPRTEAPLQRAAETGLTAEDEITLDMPAGRRVYHSSIVPTRDDAGRVTRLVGVTHDVTEYVRMQDALKEAARTVRDKDLDIRRAYVDVLAAVTGEKLVLMTREEMGASLGTPITPLSAIREPSELALARHAIAGAVRANAPEAGDPDEFMPAVSEALTNAIVHAGRGEWRVYVHDHSAQIEVSDEGSGIDFAHLPKATLLSGFSTKQTLGMGFTIMLDLADQVLLNTGPDGTIVVLEFGEELAPEVSRV